MHNRPGKYLLIKRIVRLSKESHEYFGTEILNKSKLNLMKVNDLLNVEIELNIRLGFTSHKLDVFTKYHSKK